MRMEEQARIPDRVTRLETEMTEVRGDISEIKSQLDKAATKVDMAELKQFFEKRDSDFTRNMWRVVFGLLMLLAALVVTAFGVKELPGIFG